VNTVNELPVENTTMIAELDIMRGRYLATPLAYIDKALVARWKPKASLWQRLQSLMGIQAGLKRRIEGIGDHDICYWAGGNSAGSVVVLLHGFGSSKENWSYLAAKLRRDH
jgi:abhydrolase domain-containing protein 6